jgi:transposase-like protein
MTTATNSERDTDAPRCNLSQFSCTLYGVASERQRRQAAKARRHVPPQLAVPAHEPTFLRQAKRVERLAYTRGQAAEALGISRSTFDRRILPFVEVLEMPSGTLLIPVDELERFAAIRRRASRVSRSQAPSSTRGRPPAVPPDVVRRIRTAHDDGKSLGEIARSLNVERVPTAQGGRQWWASSVRSVLVRSGRVGSAGVRQ